MSNSLVHKSLELLGYEEDLHKEQKKKKRKNMKYKGVLDIIPAKHRISKNDKTDLGTILGRSKTTTVYETLKRITTEQDPTDENVKLLLLLSSNQTNAKTANNLLQRACKQKYVPQQQKPKEPEETVFTEEDFKKFAEEYIQ